MSSEGEAPISHPDQDLMCSLALTVHRETTWSLKHGPKTDHYEGNCKNFTLPLFSLSYSMMCHAPVIIMRLKQTLTITKCVCVCVCVRIQCAVLSGINGSHWECESVCLLLSQTELWHCLDNWDKWLALRLGRGKQQVSHTNTQKQTHTCTERVCEQCMSNVLEEHFFRAFWHEVIISCQNY